MANNRTLTVQHGALVGDENLPDPRNPADEAEVVQEQVDAQVTPTKVDVADKVDVHETRVEVDEVIRDPSDPRAVQIPDAGRGSTALPIHQLGEPTPEEIFSDKAPEAEEEPEPSE